MNFKDRTFCAAKCDTADCSKRWTKELQAEAHRWWGSPDAPIAMCNFTDTCLAYTQPKFTKAGASLKGGETNG